MSLNWQGDIAVVKIKVNKTFHSEMETKQKIPETKLMQNKQNQSNAFTSIVQKIKLSIKDFFSKCEQMY